jgi:hypothetical protein
MEAVMAKTYKDCLRGAPKFSRCAKRCFTNLVRAEARAEDSEDFGVGGAFGRENKNSWVPLNGKRVRRWLPAEERAEYVYLGYGETWTREGLELLAESAIADFERAIGKEGWKSPLPWNLAKGPWLHMPRTLGGRVAYHERKFEEGEREYVHRAARFAGWLRGAAEFPRLVRAIEHVVSPKGQNSPYTHIDLWALALATRSPGRADRQFAAVRAAANQHLTAYGLRVRWGAVAQAMVKHPTRVNRPALKAAAETINAQIEYLCGQPFTGRYVDVLKKARGLAEALKSPAAHLAWAVERVERCEFASLREAMPAAAERLVFDTTDGVEMWTDPETKIRRHGITATLGFVPDVRGRVETRYLVRGSGRTFHTRYSWGGAKGAIQEAIRAWKEQRRLEKKEADLVGFLRGDGGFVPIFRMDDSTSAGNCWQGTESWVRGQGWGARKWIPGHWLIPYLGESRVRNVAVRLREEMNRKP